MNLPLNETKDIALNTSLSKRISFFVFFFFSIPQSTCLIRSIKAFPVFQQCSKRSYTVQSRRCLMKISRGEKRFALLLAAKDSEYVKSVYGGYFNVFLEAFGEEGEEWDLFRVVEGEFPEIENLCKYDGFVVSGSPFDAFGSELWILKLCFLLQTLDAMEKKVLGICFGHQVLCRALGGKVGRAYEGWDIGLRKVNIVDDLPSCKFLDDFDGLPQSLSIIECHQDEVWEVPLGAQVIGFSDKTGVEVYAIGDHVLGIQGHPEYTKDILCNLIDRLLGNNSIQRESAEEAKSKLQIADPDSKCWAKICRTFLKGR